MHEALKRFILMFVYSYQTTEQTKKFWDVIQGRPFFYANFNYGGMGGYGDMSWFKNGNQTNGEQPITDDANAYNNELNNLWGGSDSLNLGNLNIGSFVGSSMFGDMFNTSGSSTGNFDIGSMISGFMSMIMGFFSSFMGMFSGGNTTDEGTVDNAQDIEAENPEV